MKRLGLKIYLIVLRSSEAQVEHQEISLKELGEMVSTGPISKSGMNHRLRKLNELADKIRNGEQIEL